MILNKSIPVFLAGMLFFLSAHAQLPLAEQLFEEEQWAACLRECRRTGANRLTEERTRFLEASCMQCLGQTSSSILRDKFQTLAQQTNDTETSAIASYKSDRPEEANLLDKISPAKGVVSFYRSQISPAIGHRCTLEPSCSEYFLQAIDRHSTLLALPMIADRLVREPGINSRQENPVYKNGTIRFEDALQRHDFWMNP